MDLTSSIVVFSPRPSRRRGFPADLSRGFYLYARERMTYILTREPGPHRWQEHQFVAFDGRLIKIDLPPKAKLFVWPAGQGPRPHDSVACRTSIWGRVRPYSLNAESPASLNRLYRLWLQYGHLRASPPNDTSIMPPR